MFLCVTASKVDSLDPDSSEVTLSLWDAETAQPATRCGNRDNSSCKSFPRCTRINLKFRERDNVAKSRNFKNTAY